jgi:hypothetical protein
MTCLLLLLLLRRRRRQQCQQPLSVRLAGVKSPSFIINTNPLHHF